MLLKVLYRRYIATMLMNHTMYRCILYCIVLYCFVKSCVSDDKETCGFYLFFFFGGWGGSGFNLCLGLTNKLAYLIECNKITRPWFFPLTKFGLHLIIHFHICKFFLFPLSSLELSFCYLYGHHFVIKQSLKGAEKVNIKEEN